MTALLTLAVCIGANAAMFSVVRSVLLKPLPFPRSERVLLLYNSYPNAGAPHRPRGRRDGLVLCRPRHAISLFNVAPMSPIVIGLVTLVLAVVALVATGIPALRASRINPVVVLTK